jgi:hypothetical protein
MFSVSSVFFTIFQVFCAAVIMDLFSKQTFETVASTEDDDDDDDDDHNDDDDDHDDVGHEEEEEAGDDDDPICID